MIESEALLGLPEFQITGTRRQGDTVVVSVEYTGEARCPHCNSARLRKKDRSQREIRHEGFGCRRCVLLVPACKWQCRECGKYFWQRFPGLLPWQRATERYRRYIFEQHQDGVCRSRLAERERMGHATVERWLQYFLRREAAEVSGATCPRVLGIDEHFFTRRQGYATTLCDLEKHRVYDVVLGRSEAALEKYLARLKGKDRVRIVCMDLSVTYRALARKHLANALIVTDRFHVIRLIHQQFLAQFRAIDPAGAKNRGLVSLLRRHAWHLSEEQSRKLARYFREQPAIAALYEFREKLCALLLHKALNQKACRPLTRQFLGHIDALRHSEFVLMRSLGETLDSWKNEIARMWRFTRSNGITEGFHTRMEVLQRQAYGFRNFQNYRLRVKVMCR